jgi:dTDP-4-amino-4,6-dideoxygalactose transaminase
LLIEDAAQGSGGALHARPLGAHGPLSVLSFGRGKGLTGGRGGALLGISHKARIAQFELTRGGAGFGELSLAAAQWIIGRPSVFGIPAAVPWLRLGESVYREPSAPRQISRAAAAIVPSALSMAPAAIERRRATAKIYQDAMNGVPHVAAVNPIRGGTSGFLRFPVLVAPSRSTPARLGIYRSYPVALIEEAALQPILSEAERGSNFRVPGARELAARLVTLPTHELMSRHDIQAVCEWLRERTADV